MSLHDDPIIKAFEHRIKGKISDMSEYLASGKCSTFDDYKRRTGMIAGLDESLNILDDIIKNYTNDLD